MTPPDPTDTVAQARVEGARKALEVFPDFEYYSGDPRWEPAVSQCKAENEERLNALIAAVRAECADRVQVLRSVYTNVPYSDFAQGWHEACDAITRNLEAKP